MLSFIRVMVVMASLLSKSTVTKTMAIEDLFLDTSKQAIGMLFIHFANVYLADLTEEDPCSL